MEINSAQSHQQRPVAHTPLEKPPERSELQEAFTDFVGQTLFGSMLASMRKSVGKPAYMHGGRTEEVFQKQMDQLIVEDLSEASADRARQEIGRGENGLESDSRRERFGDQVRPLQQSLVAFTAPDAANILDLPIAATHDHAERS